VLSRPFRFAPCALFAADVRVSGAGPREIVQRECVDVQHSTIASTATRRRSDQM